MYNTTLRHIRATIFAVEKQLSITYSKSLCLYPQVHSTQCASTTLSFVACLAKQYFFHIIS